MSFKDVLKSALTNGFASTTVSTKEVVVCLGMVSLLAVYIFFVYRFITRKEFYNKNFNIAVAAIAIVTASVILTLQTNVAISLGTVGALSIVRFRTAVKDPMDLIFLFWGVAVGIICGAGYGEIAIFTSFTLTIGILILNALPIAKAPMILVINATDYAAETKIIDVVKKYSKYNKVKSRNLRSGSIDMIIEVRVKEESKLVQDIMKVNTVTAASLMSHDGEVTF
ncbi:MAG: DUF4956 domain-containing protein [Lachnospiraceae bacterium]|nr:DUF4956 domain-containing protein [Lachnospiraceae bacterium]